MAALLLAAASLALVLTAAVGVRLVRTTGLEDVAAAWQEQAAAADAQPGLARLVDGLGRRFQRSLLRLSGERRLTSLDVLLRRAGRPEGLTVSAFVQRQAGFTVLGLLVGALFALLGQALTGALLALVLAAWMDVWVRLVAARRQAELDRDLPDFLDVLGVTVMAGLSFRQAVERVCDFHRGPLAVEMRTALQEMSVGVSRRRAFTAVRERNSSEGVAVFVTALLQAEELGTPLAQALTDIAAEIRRERAQQVRRAAAKAAPKVSLVVTTTIVPGAMVLMVAGFVLSQADSLGGLFG